MVKGWWGRRGEGGVGRGTASLSRRLKCIGIEVVSRGVNVVSLEMLVDVLCRRLLRIPGLPSTLLHEQEGEEQMP